MHRSRRQWLCGSLCWGCGWTRESLLGYLAFTIVHEVKSLAPRRGRVEVGQHNMHDMTKHLWRYNVFTLHEHSQSAELLIVRYTMMPALDFVMGSPRHSSRGAATCVFSAS
nr:hypothetical protein CFP56_53333 [Quercus suber]